MTTAPTASSATREDLDKLVTEADMGGRKPLGGVARLLTAIAIAWSLFQLWYASPLPFLLNIGILNDTAARGFHLCFAFALAFLAYPAFAASSRTRVPLYDWALALIAIGAVLYLVVFHQALALRPGLPSAADIIASVLGVLLLLEASRRAEGPWMPLISIVCLIYVFAGPHLPGLLAHKGSSVPRAASHFWLTSEGVFGVALGVATNFIFLFVLFGALLERAGAGSYFIQLAFSLLGKFRGGPAKAAVVSSGLTGMISGSSVANVVTTGTFTIPLMKRVGYSPVQAGAIECAAGVNGQLMPPVMGAAAFLMAEYVGISYAEVCKHALLPAILTYGALFYVVDLEAVKAGMTGLTATRRRTWQQSLVKAAATWAGLVILASAIYWGFGWTKHAFGAAASWLALGTIVAAYIGLAFVRAQSPDLPVDDAEALAHIPDFYETARTGLHYLVPVVVLIWCLMIEEMSPGLAAFWGVIAMVALVITQKPLVALFRGEAGIGARARDGWLDLLAGLETGARNMTGVGIATATAGILVGTVTLTGIGLVMTEIVETLSGGSIVVMLILVALICIVLGTGLPTTASYVVVATLMAPVVVELAAQNDLAVPLIAVHMFVFYFGLMADVTPPVGLAAYAAGAIAGADPIKVGWQGTWYEFRTVLLPFIFIFNPEMLMIDIGGPVHFLAVLGAGALAMMAFCAAFQGFFLTYNRWWETAALLLACFTLFRPGFWLDLVSPAFVTMPASAVVAEIERLPAGSAARVKISSENRRGDSIDKLVRLELGPGKTINEKLVKSGLSLSVQGQEAKVLAARFGSAAAKSGLQPGDSLTAILKPADRMSRNWFLLPGLALLGLVWAVQRRRRRSTMGTTLPALVPK
jgi:TRAP transporter 4TM/12TM fusion protein